MGLKLLLLFITLLGTVPNLGFFTFPAFLLISLTVFFLYADLFLGKTLIRIRFTGRENIHIAFIILVLFSFLFYGGLYQNVPSIIAGSFFFGLIILVTIINYFFLKKPRDLYVFFIITYVSLAVWTLVNSPRPVVDTYVVFKEAPLKLLLGENPYASQYTQIYAGKTFFHYLPNSFLLALPFVAVFQDPRFLIIAANVFSALMMRRLFKKSNVQTVTLFILVFLFLPRSFYILEHMYLDPVIFFFFLSFLFFAIRKKNALSMMSLSLFFTLKQHLLILLPFFITKKMAKDMVKPKNLLAFIFPFIPLIIFFLLDKNLFIERTITGMLGPVIKPQLDSQRSTPLNMSLSIQPLLQLTFLGKNTLLKYGFSFSLLVLSYALLFIKRKPLLSSIITLLFIFNYFMYISFFNSYYFICLFLLIGIGFDLFTKKHRS